MRWIVYETRCLVSGKIYVGVHRQDEDGFDGYLGSGKALKRAIKKHGVENFVRRTLEEFSVEDEAYAREAKIVTEEFCKRRDTYNVKPGGLGGLGYKHTPEARERMRGNTNRLGKAHTPETREKMQGNTNRLGKAHTPESREKMSEKKRGNKNALGNKNFLGKKHTPKARAKIAEANRRRAWKPESREKCAAARRGKPHTPESREKIREANLRRWANHRNNAL